MRCKNLFMLQKILFLPIFVVASCSRIPLKNDSEIVSNIPPVSGAVVVLSPDVHIPTFSAVPELKEQFSSFTSDRAKQLLDLRLEEEQSGYSKAKPTESVSIWVKQGWFARVCEGDPNVQLDMVCEVIGSKTIATGEVLNDVSGKTLFLDYQPYEGEPSVQLFQEDQLKEFREEGLYLLPQNRHVTGLKVTDNFEAWLCPQKPVAENALDCEDFEPGIHEVSPNIGMNYLVLERTNPDRVNQKISGYTLEHDIPGQFMIQFTEEHQPRIKDALEVLALDPYDEEALATLNLSNETARIVSVSVGIEDEFGNKKDQILTAELSNKAKKQLMEDERVSSISVDSIIKNGLSTVRTETSWNLQQTWKDNSPEGGSLFPWILYWPFLSVYDYQFTSDGSSSLENDLGNRFKIYGWVVDGKINEKLEEFQGRVQQVITTKDIPNENHGTGVASIFAGKRWGVASGAQIRNIVINTKGEKGYTVSSLMQVLENLLADVKINSRQAKSESYNFGGVANLSLDFFANLLMELSQAYEKRDNNLEALTFRNKITLKNKVKNILEEINSLGVLVVISSGNEGIDLDNYMNYPGGDFPSDSAIVVGAVNKINSLASFSNIGKRVDIYAPGVDVVMVDSEGGRTTRDGTSFASPMVAGYALRVMQNTLQNTQVSGGDLSKVVRDNIIDNAAFGRISGGSRVKNSVFNNRVLYMNPNT